MADGSFPPAPAPFSDAEIDVHVGARLKARRKSVGLSQKALAAQLRVAFQQVQKYETGENRMSCAKLFACAGALGWTANDFFVGLPELAAAAALDPAGVARRQHQATFAAQVREAALIAPEIARIGRLSPAERAVVRSLLTVMGAGRGDHNPGGSSPPSPARRARLGAARQEA